MDNSYELKIDALSQISDILSRTEDVHAVLDDLLAKVIKLAGYRAGWIYLRDGDSESLAEGSDFYRAAFHSQSPEIDPAAVDAMRAGCKCQALLASGEMGEAYGSLSCTRPTAGKGNSTQFIRHSTIFLQAGNYLLGSLSVVGPYGEVVNPGELEILAIIGAHLSTALDRSRLVSRVTEKHVHEQTTLLTLSSQLLSRSKPEDVANLLVQEVVRVFKVDASALLLPDEQSGYLISCDASGWYGDSAAEERRELSNNDRSFGKVIRRQVPILSRGSNDREKFSEVTREWLEEAGFEGLAIVPLIVDEISIGALALAMRTQREFDADEMRMLQILANQAGIAIVNARLQKEEIQLHRLEKELSIGCDIQRSLLPDSSPRMEGWQFSDLYRPARQVGGDLYDYFHLPYGEKLLGLVIGDVADKGVPAALFMATSRTLIRSTALAGLTPGSALTEANQLILQDSTSELFLSAFYGILDMKNGKLSYANAGHNPPYYYQRSAGAFIELSAKGILLCVKESINLEEKTLKIAKGDVLVLYTDGVTEAVNKDYVEYGPRRLRNAIAANAHKSTAKILEAIVNAVDSFVGDMEQIDDITLIVIKRL